ncbi:MAG: hypothetical protein H7Y59_03830 [Anaerolineales bacterium]|nr:hypothetical protein [Anaerolineales bacterium]
MNTKVLKRGRILGLLFAILFIASTTLLLIASTSQSPLAALGGYADVSIVVLIFFCGFSIHQMNTTKPRYDISYQVAIYLLPIILVITWIFRASIDFNILLPGLAWRTYFFLSILPRGLTFWRPEQTNE